jgi:Oxysterol-binding protein
MESKKVTGDDAGNGSTWGGWLSSMANSAMYTVLGENQAPDTFEALETNDSVGRESPTANEFSEVDSASRQALWKQLMSVIGMDVMNMRLSLPIWLFEPTTALTRMCETFEFSELLDRAAKENDPVLRDALVAAFVISAFAHTERVRKPFNPVLGESMFCIPSTSSNGT